MRGKLNKEKNNKGMVIKMVRTYIISCEEFEEIEVAIKHLENQRKSNNKIGVAWGYDNVGKLPERGMVFCRARDLNGKNRSAIDGAFFCYLSILQRDEVKDWMRPPEFGSVLGEYKTFLLLTRIVRQTLPYGRVFALITNKNYPNGKYIEELGDFSIGVLGREPIPVEIPEELQIGRDAAGFLQQCLSEGDKQSSQQ
ncbi:MAG: hypothetical protein DRN40_08470 [Thermoplasmata archaeon]|nr:MAG: hypothetical protein DRN40_08470 [Thermoplasmata archaeon]